MFLDPRIERIYQKFRKVLEHFRNFSNFKESSIKFQNIPECPRTYRTLQEGFQASQKPLEFFFFRKVSEHVQKVREIYRTLQKVQESTGIFDKLFQFSKIFSIFPKNSRKFQNIPSGLVYFSTSFRIF